MGACQGFHENHNMANTSLVPEPVDRYLKTRTVSSQLVRLNTEYAHLIPGTAGKFHMGGFDEDRRTYGFPSI
jgi:hypothetical protein